MTDFGTLEASREDSRPLILIKVELGSETFLWSTGETVTLGSEEYVKTAAAHTRVTVGADQKTNTVQITLPASNSFVSRYIGVVPVSPALVSIFRVQRDEVPTFDTVVPIYQGFAESVSFPDDTEIAQVNVRSIASTLSRNIPTFTYTSLCNHFLFGPGCGVDPGVFSLVSTVTAESDSEITVTGAGASSLTFPGGYVQSLGASDFRLILGISGDDLILQIPFASSLIGLNVQVYPRCDHKIDGDCARVFNNTKEFGGFPDISNRNPFEDGIDE